MNLVQDTLRGVFKFNRGQADKGVMQKQKGFSLTEILVGIGILGIMGSIATVSYRGYILDVTKKTLKDSGTLFQVAVNTCVQGKRGWEIPRYTQGTETCSSGETDPCIKTYPCNATTTEELKKKLNYTCPAGATCRTHVHGNTQESKYRYYCLSIEKEVSGKKLQVIIRVSYDNPSIYQMLCGDDMSKTTQGDYMPLQSDTCKKGRSQTLTDHGFTTNETDKADRKIILCQWK